MYRADGFIEELDRLAAEAVAVYTAIVQPTWGSAGQGMPDTLYGYMMGVFARLDLVSSHWNGTEDAQSKRITDFLCAFVGCDRTAASIAVNMWRHKLMHTSSPRPLTDPATGTVYRWLLHWGPDQLPRPQHFVIQNEVLNLSLFSLIDDVRKAILAYQAQLQSSTMLQAKYDSMQATLSNYKLKTY